MPAHQDYADRIRGMIRHENDLVNHRMSWLLATQAFLLTALSFVWGKDPFLCTVIAVVGVAVAVSIGLSCKLSIRAISGLQRDWGQKQPEEEEGTLPEPPVIGLPSNEVGEDEKLLLPWDLLPKVFAGAWIVILLVTWILDPSVPA